MVDDRNRIKITGHNTRLCPQEKKKESIAKLEEKKKNAENMNSNEKAIIQGPVGIYIGIGKSLEVKKLSLGSLPFQVNIGTTEIFK